MTAADVANSPHPVVEAWDLIGHHGTFRILGGRAIYEAVCYNIDRARGDRVRLARLESDPLGVRQLTAS